MEEADLVIIGAGIYGLTTAHTYHHLHPSAKVLILDSAPSIGGPWAPHRVFPGLRTNNLWGMYEHPDFPMDEKRFMVKRGEHIPAARMFDYLCAFAKWADIEKFFRGRTDVEVIEQDKDGEGWMLRCAPTVLDKKGAEIKAKKLVIAVGNTNKPLLPHYETSTTFQPMVVHTAEFPEHYPVIAKPDKHTVIVGSGKSAWDVAYACASQPSATATILIRPDGNGPVWMTPSHVTPLGLWLEKLVHTRFFGFMSPCPWAPTTGIEGWLRSFFHRTWLGRKIGKL
jgi:cation diffusion facilitator CzcD-associated flavoprotein CzcO